MTPQNIAAMDKLVMEASIKEGSEALRSRGRALFVIRIHVY